MDSRTTEFMLRAFIAFLFVLACYLFNWHWLRAITATVNLAIDQFFGVHLARIAPDAVLYGNGIYYYVISCTMADVWCGALPFLYDSRPSNNVHSFLARNAFRLAVFTPALFLFNVVRLSISDILFAHSVPWIVAHSIFAGFCYYAIWIILWRTRTFAR